MSRDTVAPDGSPVDLYRLLPSEGEPELIHEAIPAGADVLELGCGAGRMTHALTALGHAVTAVDESPAMLACVHGAGTVLERIEDLALGRRFPAVVLASYLVNTPDKRRRQRFLTACARHVERDGMVLVERLDPQWAATATPAMSQRHGIEVGIADIRRHGPLISMLLLYRAADQAWEHPFTAEVLDGDRFDETLLAAGLRRLRWLDSRLTWALLGLAPLGSS